MKKIFKVLIFLLLIGMSIALLFIGNGYNMYKEAIESMPLEEKVEENKVKRKLCRVFRITTNVCKCSN